MTSSDKTYTITEYTGFTRGIGINIGPYQNLSEKTFDELEAFILANESKTDTETTELLSLSARRGIGKIITARNYVGLITMKDGTVIEILPKIAGYDISDEEKKSEIRKMFLEMLRTLKDVTFKDFNFSNLDTDRLNLLEIFIKMFLDEVSILVKQGLKAAYIPLEDNKRFYKGKLLTAQNIKYNLVRRDRFYVRYDDFNINRSENRLIKSTLRFLLKQTTDSRNRMNAMRLLNYFDGVEYSKNYDADFSNCIKDRSMNHYEKALSWCRVSLCGNSFTAYAGGKVAIALLFPMEKIFESFVTAKFRKHIGKDIHLRAQDSRYSLFDRPTRAFALRPDLVLESGGRTFVLDTKWKLLYDNARNMGISQADMYQMYAYSKKYDADNVIMLYPKSENVSEGGREYVSDDNVNVHVCFVDLRNSDHSVAGLLANKMYHI